MLTLNAATRNVMNNNEFFNFSADELRLPKVTTDTDTAGSVSTDAGVLKRARSRHYLNGKYAHINVCLCLHIEHSKQKKKKTTRNLVNNSTYLYLSSIQIIQNCDFRSRLQIFLELE